MFTTRVEDLPLVEDAELEESRVARWRFDQFRALGFELADAFLLTASRVDLHAARTLAGTGCPPALALRILL
jgi:hypothetical protein